MSIVAIGTFSCRQTNEHQPSLADEDYVKNTILHILVVSQLTAQRTDFKGDNIPTFVAILQLWWDGLIQ